MSVDALALPVTYAGLAMDMKEWMDYPQINSISLMLPY